MNPASAPAGGGPGAARGTGGRRAWVLPAAAAVGRRPWLWPTAVAQVLRLARRGWWRRWPPVPAPDPAYLRFRARTAYGDDRPPDAGDIVAWLSWCRPRRRFR